jgi:hypothetical protein
MDEEVQRSRIKLICFFILVLFWYLREVQSDVIRRGSRVRKNIVQIENLPSAEDKRKKKITKNNDENRAPPEPKIKLVGQWRYIIS